MVQVLEMLDAEWGRLAHGVRARRVVRRWADQHPALSGLVDLEHVRLRQRKPEEARMVLEALVALAPTDWLAARTVLQMLLPGLVQIAKTYGHGDPDAVGRVVAMAWEMIRTYPRTRKGSVAGSILLDVRKRYWREQGTGEPLPAEEAVIEHGVEQVPSPENEAVNRVLFMEVLAAQRNGVLNESTFQMVMRTRWAGTPLKEIAEEEDVSLHSMVQRRCRAEAKLGQALRAA